MKHLTSKLRFLLFAVVLSVIGACAADQDKAQKDGPNLLANLFGARVGGKEASNQSSLFRGLGPSPDRRVLGTDNFLSELDKKPSELVAVTDSGSFNLNLIEVPIEQAARAVLGEALKENYAIAPGVDGAITLQTTRPLTDRELLETFQTVLELSGLTLQRDSSILTVAPLAGASKRITMRGQPIGPGSRIVAVPLQFIGTAEMLRLLGPISGSGVALQPIESRNILLVSGSRNEINSTIDAINLFDVDVLKGKSVGLFKLRAAEPEALVEELQLIFETQEGGNLENVISFVPSQRLGAVLVITTRSKYLAKAERWIRDLDRTAGGSKRRPVVYSLQNRSAVDLAPVLSEMLTNSSRQDTEEQPDRAQVLADDTRNAIIVWGNDTEQEALSRLVQQLDTTPVQVLLEATIAEVSLNDNLEFGLRWSFENGRLSGAFTDAEIKSTASKFPGLSLLFQGSSAAVTLNALASLTEVNIVSSPSLLVLDNQEARLQIGDEVPVATQQARDVTDPNAPVVNTISFRDTGIILRVKPRVSRSGQMILNIEQEVSTVSNTTSSGIDSPTVSQRKIDTSVSVSNGQTIALGGLIEETRNDTTKKVPGAGDIPLIGALFRNKNDKASKKELLVLITPRVIRDGREAREVTDELRRRINDANGLILNGTEVKSTGHRIVD